MNKVTIACLVVMLGLVWGKPADDYGDEFDHIDIDEILASERLVDNYIHCAKTGQKCTPEGQKLREKIPDALKNKCSRCSEEQKGKIYKILEWAIQNRPNDFLEIENIHDPDHYYREFYKAELEARNIVLPPV